MAEVPQNIVWALLRELQHVYSDEGGGGGVGKAVVCMFQRVLGFSQLLSQLLEFFW